jgi:nicotinamidase-related amidase
MVAANRGIVVGKIKPAKLAAKAVGVPVVYVTNYLSPGLTEGSVWRNLTLRMPGVDVLRAWREPNDSLAFSKVIAPEPGDHVVRKQFFSGFFETHLDSLLRSLGVKDIVLVGFDARVCLRTTAVDAMFRNYRVITLRDCISYVHVCKPETL